ncbi:hypothetical protein DY000_02012788 [Brassica cretica]|uniref:Uncharacterized protein n=1 Tax=Brassica cretica TaxID=69181 RepID=A0ABQ7CPA5_BRACR|nr:hypothetical protein DY000_02012788 [Brassica cretica]
MFESLPGCLPQLPAHKFELCAVDMCPALPKRSDSLTWQSDGLCLKISRVAFSTIAGSPSASGLGRDNKLIFSVSGGICAERGLLGVTTCATMLEERVRSYANRQNQDSLQLVDGTSFILEFPFSSFRKNQGVCLYRHVKGLELCFA